MLLGLMAFKDQTVFFTIHGPAGDFLYFGKRHICDGDEEF
jgi:hypothetical protein